MLIREHIVTPPTPPLPNSSSAIRQRAAAGMIPPAGPLGMTFVRIGLFAAYQALAALICLLAGRPAPWQAAIAWWPVTVTAANLTCMARLRLLARREGLRMTDLYNFDRRTVGRDLLLVLALLVIGGPLGYLPMVLLGQALFGGAAVVADRWIMPLPSWIAVTCAILFPLTIALSELPTYFGYAMPRLQVPWRRRWLPVLLPLVVDARFMFWRLTRFLPFALFLGLLLNWRPRLLPYLMVVHGLMDVSLVVYVLMKSVT
jgi:hypothetical protein